jgi:predicted DNA-binding transcriptional regulator YafY
MPKHRAWLEEFQLTDSQAQLLREAIEDPSIMGQMMDQGLFALRKLLAFNAPFDLELQGEKQGKSEESANFLKIHKAFLAGKVLEVDYPSHTGKLERRYFSPYAIFYRYGYSYMIAGCHRTKTPKTLLVDRIKRVRVSNKVFLRQPKGFDAGKYIKTGYYNYEPKLGKIARFRVKAQEAWRIRDKHSRFIVAEGKNGSVDCEFFVTNLNSFFKFILAFGFDAEVLSPLELRRQFKKFLEKAIA